MSLESGLSTKILIGNLPPDTTEDEVTAVMSEKGWPMLKVLSTKSNHLDRCGFMVEVDMPREGVAEMLRRRGDIYFKERKLTVYVPVMMG